MSHPHMVLRTVVFLLMSAICILGCLAQTPEVKQPSPGSVRVEIPVVIADREQIVAYWTSETGWKSELQLRNNQTSQDLNVTPALRLADGSETNLLPVTIKPQEVKSVDLDAAISAAKAPQLVGAYGSVVLRYRSGSTATLYAAMMIRRTGHPVTFHIDAMGESPEFQLGGREGVWWLPNDTASDYLILTNQGSTTIPVDLSLYDASGKNSTQKIILASRETTRYSVRKLVQAAHLGGSYGGIKVSAPSHAGSLDTLHFLFDEKAEFSVTLKMFDYNQNSNLEERDFAKTAVWTLRAPMLALANPDPALAFPPGITLHPKLLVRNTTGKSLNAALRFVWRDDKQTGNAIGPALRLNSNETRLVDVGALQDAGVIPKQANWTSVTLTTNGSPGEVMAVAASYDETFHYGAQTPFSDQLNFRWEGGMWEYDTYHSSIMTAGNGGTKPMRAALTIFYNQGAEKYELEQTLKPDEQMWVDVGKLIREQIPDKNGKTLPFDLTMGSYEFRDLTDTIVGSLFEGKVIYDKTYGHVAYGCAFCCGHVNPQLTFNPLGIVFSGGSQNGVQAVNACNGGRDDISANFYGRWGTANTAIATVDNYGYHNGMGVGSTTSQTNGTFVTEINQTHCPIVSASPSGGDNVQKPYFLKVVSVTTDTTVCLNNGCETHVKYRVVDVNGTPINIPGMTVAETVTVVSNTCNTVIQDAATWSTDPTGTMTQPDIIRYCCGPGESCRTVTNQTFTVNGTPVYLLNADGITSGSHNVITNTCDNQHGNCAIPVITP